MKRLICAVLALMMALCLCACGGEEAPAAEPTPAATAEPTPAATAEPTIAEVTEPAQEDGKVTYTIHVQDENGTAIAGAMVQICKDTCLPGMTDAEGNAVFTVDEADYKVSFLSLPAGYTYTTEETEFYFNGATEITLTLKAE